MPDPIPAPSVVVTPVQPSESRTLRTVFYATLAGCLAALPDIIATIAQLMSYPEVSQAVYQYIPVPLRAVLGIVWVVVMQRLGWLRKDTDAPIAGTLRADAAQPLHVARSTAVREQKPWDVDEVPQKGATS